MKKKKQISQEELKKYFTEYFLNLPYDEQTKTTQEKYYGFVGQLCNDGKITIEECDRVQDDIGDYSLWSIEQLAGCPFIKIDKDLLIKYLYKIYYNEKHSLMDSALIID